MDRDQFEKALCKKVGDVRIEPPADVWARIASNLDSAGNGVESEDRSAKESSPMPRKIRIRSPRKLRWGYAAAAAAILVCALVFSYRMGGLGDQIVAQYERQSGQIEIIDMEISPVGAYPSEIGGQESGLEANNAVGRINGPSPYGNSQVQEQTGMNRIAMTADDTGLSDDISATSRTLETIGDNEVNRNDGSDQNDQVGVSSGDGRPGATRRNIPSDIGTKGAPVTRWNGAEAVGRKRRAAPIEMSLYATNSGTGSNGSGTSSSALRASSNDFVIYEMGPATPNGTREITKYNPVKLKHKFPISFGINLSKGLSSRWSVESGVTYSYLYSESETPTRDNQWKYEQKLHYVGIPVGVKYNIVDRPLYNLYASAGGLFEICVSGKRVETLYDNGSKPGASNEISLNVYGIQPSVNIHLGAEFNMSRRLGIYIEPGMSYYFDTQRQPDSYRTENSINFSFRAGIRIKMSK